MADTRARLVKIRNGLTPAEWARAGAMVAIIVGLNVAGWVMLAAAVGGHYHITSKEIFGFGTGILAYTLGMRHAFDADHIAAIDNTTRKLVQDGKRPLSVGFFFSLGPLHHRVRLALLLNFGIRALDQQVKNDGSGLHNATGIIGTTVSGTFLYLIALLNLVVLISIVKVFREMRARQLQRRGTRAPARQPRADEPVLRRLRQADRHAAGRCTRSGCCSASASTPPPRSPCWCWRAPRSSAACRSTRSCRCRSCSPPACACSTPPTAAS